MFEILYVVMSHHDAHHLTCPMMAPGGFPHLSFNDGRGGGSPFGKNLSNVTFKATFSFLLIDLRV